LNGYCFDFLQATTVSVEDSVDSLLISAVYLPPKHIVKQEQLETFYNTLGQRFIAGGDYNTKHTAWGSRLYAQRTKNPQNDETPTPTPSLHGRTHLLAF
jgi:hypothetical protein